MALNEIRIFSILTAEYYEPILQINGGHMRRRIRLAILILSGLFIAVSLHAQDDGSKNERPMVALRADLRPITLGFSAGGFGVSLGGELPVGGRFSVVLDVQYMNLADASLSMLTLHAGPRMYFALPSLAGFYGGAQGIVLFGRDFDELSTAFGLGLELGYLWRVQKRNSFFFEPYLKYFYFFGGDLLVGIAPNISIGWIF